MKSGLIRGIRENRCPICIQGSSKCAISLYGFPSINSRGVYCDYLVVASMVRRELFSLLQSYGKVESIKLCVDKSGVLKCITCFARCIDCSSLLDRSSHFNLFGNVLSMERCYADDFNNEEEIKDTIDESIMEASRTLYISNIHEKTTHDDLWDYFAKYGHVITVESNRMPLYAFIQYSNISSVVRAVIAGRTDYMWGRKLKLNFGKTLKWRSLWIKINGVFIKDDIIGHIKRISRPERFEIDNGNAEMLVFYRRPEDAVYGFKKLRTNQNDNGYFIMVDFSSDKMDKYFLRRQNIEVLQERKCVDSNKMSDILHKQSCPDSSSICSFDSNGGKGDSVKQKISSMSIASVDKLVVVDSSCQYNPVEEKALQLINMIHPHLNSSEEYQSVDCSSVLMNHVISCLRLSDPPRPPSPSLDLSFVGYENMVRQSSVGYKQTEMTDLNDKKSDNISEDGCVEKKLSFREKITTDHTVELFDDLFAPDNLISTNHEGKKAVNGKEVVKSMNSEDQSDNLSNESKSDYKITTFDSKTPVSESNNTSKREDAQMSDEEFSPPKRQRKRVSHICIESDDEKAVVDVYNDIVTNAAKEVGISMYDSIKIRRIYNNSKKDQEDEKKYNTTRPRKRKLSSDSTHSSGTYKRKTENNVEGDESVGSTVVMDQLNLKEEIIEEIKNKANQNGYSSKKRKALKTKISAGLSRILKNNGKFLRNQDVYKAIPIKDVECAVKEEVKSSPPLDDKTDSKSDSDSTITVVHSDVCSPITEECPPQVDKIETDCGGNSTPSTSVVYSQSYVYSGVPYDIHYYQQPPIYLSPIEMMRPNVGFVHPNSFVYSNDSFAPTQQNYCLQPVSLHQYIPRQNTPYDLIPTKFGQVQYVRSQQPYFQRLSKDMISPLCSQGVRIQQPYFVASPNIVCAPVQSLKEGQQLTTLGNTFCPIVPVLTPEHAAKEQTRQPLKGCLMMKKASVQVDYHYITGSYSLAERIMPIEGTVVADLQMTQRMHLIKSQIDEVEKRLNITDKWCCFVVTPHMEENNLSVFRKNFVEYLSLKNVAGIISYTSSRDKIDELFPVIYFIPPGDLSMSLLARWTTEDNRFRREKDIFVAIVSGK